MSASIENLTTTTISKGQICDFNYKIRFNYWSLMNYVYLNKSYKTIL